jgi:hypothetical protein
MFVYLYIFLKLESISFFKNAFFLSVYVFTKGPGKSTSKLYEFSLEIIVFTFNNKSQFKFL